MNFLAPYPVTPLKEVKNELLKRPPGKVVVLPPTETAKVIVDIAGVEHKFIDKFHIYYLDLAQLLLRADRGFGQQVRVFSASARPLLPAGLVGEHCA